MAQEEGFEPPTSRLTAGCSTTELLLNFNESSQPILIIRSNTHVCPVLIVRSGNVTNKRKGKILMKDAVKLDAHIFVCTNERPAGHPRGCCKGKNSESLIQAFKEALAKVGLQKKIRAQKSGCLDTCEFGPSVVIYPDNVWYGHVKVEDIPEIIQSHFVEGKPVERLKIPGK